MKNPNVFIRKFYFFLVITILAFITVKVFSVMTSNSKKDLSTIKEFLEEGEDREENGPDKQLNSWYLQKAYPNFENLSQKYLTAWQQYLDIKNSNIGYNTRNTTSMGNWTANGPSVLGGRVLSIAINRQLNASGQRTIFAGSASGGIWRTYTSGVGATAWHKVQTNTPVLGVATIVYHPTDTSIIIAGTGEVYRIDTVTNGANSSYQTGNIGRNVWRARGSYGIGILRSTDAGATWSQVLTTTLPDMFAIQKIKYDPNNANVVYACATDGLYKSTNTGASFIKIHSSAYVNDIVINPANSNEVIIVNGNLDRTDKGIWRSINAGSSFTKLTPVGFPTASQYKGYISLSVAGTGAPYTLIAGVGKGDVVTPNNYSTENEIYFSTDFGTSWSLISNSNYSNYQCWFSHCITPFPVAGGSNPNKLFLGGVSKYVLEVAGITGTRTNIGAGTFNAATYMSAGAQEGASTYMHSDIHDIQFVPGSLSEAYFATDGGIFRTTVANAAPSYTTNITFQSCNGGLQIHQFYPNIAQSFDNAGLILGGLQDNGVVRSRGNTWARVVGGDGGAQVFKPLDESIILQSLDARNVFKSTDSGKTRISPAALSWLGTLSAPSDDRTGFIVPIAVSAADPNRFYVGSDNIHVSTDAGGSFTGNGVPGTNYIEAINKTAVAIGVSNTNADKLYVSVSPFAQNVVTHGLHYNPPSNIRKSIDGGTVFTSATGNLPDRIYTDILVSPTNDDSVFVTLGGFGTAHIYVTGNGGSTWSPVSSNLPDVPFNCLLMDNNNNNILYAGCDLGIYVSPDRGINWFDFNGGLWDATYVMDLTLAPGNKVIAATHGKGLFESTRWNGIVILPVNFNNFIASSENGCNKLSWDVSSESNLRNYVVEKSFDGIYFSGIAELPATNRLALQNYNYLDCIQTNRRCYYRIKAVSFDNTFRYSPIRVLESSKQNTSFTVLQNPFVNEISIRYSLQKEEKLNISIIDLAGRVLKRETHQLPSTNGTFKMTSVGTLPPATYILHIRTKQQSFTKKLVKQS